MPMILRDSAVGRARFEAFPVNLNLLISEKYAAIRQYFIPDASHFDANADLL